MPEANRSGLLEYTPDEDVKVHEEGAIRLICKAFQSHENGLPEWLKNSADAYAREDAPEAKRVIVLIFDHGRRNAKNSISCLDFSGMTSSVIEQSFRIWADPDAARRGAQVYTAVQGGHGNGGKCYMTQMFEDFSMIHTVKNGKGNRYAVISGSVRFGYVPDKARGRDIPVPDLRLALDGMLRGVGCSVQALPKAAIEAFRPADGVTLVWGLSPRGYDTRIPVHHLVTNLEEHPQMIRTLELCKVYVIVNGEVFNDGKPLALPEIQPLEGAKEPRIIAIPATIPDPVSEQQVSTTNGGKLPAGTLTLRTSEVSMRWSKKGRHNVVFKTHSGYIGYTPVLKLDVQSPYRDRIYGECYLEALDPYKQNERGVLANSPLARATERFIAERLEAYAKEFEALERRRYEKDEKNAISKMNEALDRWKNRFLNEFMRGLWGSEGGHIARPAEPSLPTGRPAGLELTLTHHRAGLGVAFRPILKFLDDTGKQIRAVPFRWVSDDTNVAMVDEDLMVINTFSSGVTSIYAETLDRKLSSNKVALEVVRIREVRIVPSELEIETGSRRKLEAVCRLANGEEIGGVYLVWTESAPSVARVSSAGLVFGFAPGTTEVVAGDDKVLSAPTTVRVIPDEGRGTGRKRGRGYPRVFVSGEVDPDPDTGEYVHFSREDPPVAQRPQDVDRNIWWINSTAPLAKLYLDSSRAYGYQSREWRMYHLERYIDIMVQIALTHGPTQPESMPVSDWILRWGAYAANLQGAAVSDLGEFIAIGRLPGE